MLVGGGAVRDPNVTFERKVVGEGRKEEKIKKKIEKLVYPLIKRDMLECLESKGKLDSYINSTIKGIQYLDDLYLNSGYYEERKPINPKHPRARNHN